MIELALLLFLAGVVVTGCARSWRFFRRVQEAISGDRAARHAALSRHSRRTHPG